VANPAESRVGATTCSHFDLLQQKKIKP